MRGLRSASNKIGLFVPGENDRMNIKVLLTKLSIASRMVSYIFICSSYRMVRLEIG